MILRFFLRFSFTSLLTIALISSVVAQPALPDMMAVTQNGVNVLSWISQFDGVKTIAVQRSNDSVYNFSTIGYVKSIKKGSQAFIDGHPNPGTNWYRLYIVFSSDLSWYSNRVKLDVDSAQLMKKGVLPPNDSLQKMVSTLSLDNGAVPDATEINAFTYIRSQYVFTNPFTGHVNVELPDEDDRKSVFSLTFFDSKDKQVLNVPKIPERAVIIDKRNFQRKGIYKFEMRKNQDLLETGYITIY